MITCFVFSDMLDGYMARTMGVSSKWGAFLDSTLDRFGDAAVFSGLAIWFFRDGDNRLLAYVALWVLVMGSVTSYARARAESLGMVAKVGIAERSDRLVSVLLLTGFSGIFDWPILIAIALWALAVATHRHRRPTHGLGSPTGSRRPDVAVLNARRQPRDRARRPRISVGVGGDQAGPRAGCPSGPARGRRRPGLAPAWPGRAAARGQPPAGGA